MLVPHFITKFAVLVVVLLPSTVPVAAQPAPPCDTKNAIAGNDSKYAKLALAVNTGNWQVKSTQCASFQAIVRMATRERRAAASQLKPRGGRVDAAAAEAEVYALRADSGTMNELQTIANEPNPLLRLLLEAAVFDNAGKYVARDLRIEQARDLAETQ